MTPFRRQAEPSFWGPYERRWLYEAVGKTIRPLHDWEVEPEQGSGKRSLASWFHALVRAAGEPARCAYCDGPLRTESAETIDHFIPQSKCRDLALTWSNLYPACTRCNTTFKRTQWSCRLVRPDVDPVEDWFDFDEETGALAPAPELDRQTRARVRLTIRVFQLNTSDRCAARQMCLRGLQNAFRCRDLDYIVEAMRQGPYRFIAKKFVAGNRARMGSLV